jgi:CRISPR-associated protein Csd1
MLLNHLYDYAIAENLLENTAFHQKPVHYLIDLDAAGKFLSVGKTSDNGRAKEFSLPLITGTSPGIAKFLADGLTAVFGLETKLEETLEETRKLEKQMEETGLEAKKARKTLETRKQNNAAKRNHFWQQIEKAASETKHPGLSALKSFGDSLARMETPDFLLRLGTSDPAKTKEQPAWWLRVSPLKEEKLKDETFTFRINGEILLENETIRQWWYKQHTEKANLTDNNSPKGLCLVTGLINQPIAETHSLKISGVANTLTFGATIVSFDKEACWSYGFKQSLNASISTHAATAYATALNSLLKNEETHIKLGNTTLCFWVQKHKNTQSLLSKLLNKPNQPTIHSFLTSPWETISQDSAKTARFIAVTLAGNQGRIAVRHWLQYTVEETLENLKNWFEDLQIHLPHETGKTSDKITPFSLLGLASTTVREFKDLKPNITEQLCRAALENTAPPITLIKPILQQLASRFRKRDKDHYNPKYPGKHKNRFALLKLIHNRNRKKTDMEIKPALTTDSNDDAYNCGRLLSVLTDTQRNDQKWDKDRTNIADRYFSTANISPASVLPILLRLNRHHLNSLRRHGESTYQEKQIQEILNLFKSKNGQLPEFPRNLNLQAQGRFALGFYQQQIADKEGRLEGSKSKETKPEDQNPDA